MLKFRFILTVFSFTDSMKICCFCHGMGEVFISSNDVGSSLPLLSPVVESENLSVLVVTSSFAALSPLFHLSACQKDKRQLEAKVLDDD